VVFGALVLAAVVVAGALWYQAGRADDEVESARAGMSKGDPAAELADAFAAAWSNGTLATVPATVASGDVAARTEVIATGLGAAAAPPTVTVTSLEADGTGDRATATLAVSWPIDGERTWEHAATVDVVRQADATWAVDWTPATVHPQLADGDRLDAQRTPAGRGQLLGLDGTPIVGDRPVVVVGIRPGATADRAATASQVAQAVGVDPAALTERVQAAAADSVVSVITLRKEAFDEVRSWVSTIPGVELQETVLPLAPTRDFARALIGAVGPATEEQAAASAGRVAVGDTVGVSGLQAARDAELGGSPAIIIRRVPAAAGAEPVVLEQLPPVDGEDVTITIDPTVQAAADAALASAPGPAALVAIRPSNGDVLAVANGPAGADGYNRALIGRYPPGSVFKVVSGLGILASGVTPDTVIACPATYVAGKEFGNAGGFALGDVPFRTDFARSCNTAFVSQADAVGDDVLTAIGSSLGYRDLDLGVPAFGGSVPATESEAEHASNMIGQGKVQASPLAVALASASVAAGRTLEPRLVVDPEAPAPDPGAEIVGAATVRELMRAVVTEGTGSALAGVPGGEVFGKSGTAEFGTEDPPQTHAWFTGFQGDLAFAVLVEGGSSGGGVAAPLAARFLTDLADG
jgi:cell division protein FtsI/penicillin-binding protein 2